VGPCTLTGLIHCSCASLLLTSSPVYTCKYGRQPADSFTHCNSVAAAHACLVINFVCLHAKSFESC
jgi:hypothetical protein